MTGKRAMKGKGNVTMRVNLAFDGCRFCSAVVDAIGSLDEPRIPNGMSLEIRPAFNASGALTHYHLELLRDIPDGSRAIVSSAEMLRIAYKRKADEETMRRGLDALFG